MKMEDIILNYDCKGLCRCLPNTMMEPHNMEHGNAKEAASKNAPLRKIRLKII